MNYKSFSLGDWIGHISGVIEDETTLDGNEMRDLVVFLTTLNQQPCEDCISREAVLDALHVEGRPTKKFDYVIAVQKDIIALPPVTPKQQPCDDCISRQVVLDAINTYDKFGYTEAGCFVREPKGDYVPYIHYDDVIKCVKNVPPVTPKEKTGHWINAKAGKLFPSNDFKCSECGNILDFDGVNCGRGDANYCPNCGAKMIEPQESEVNILRQK